MLLSRLLLASALLLAACSSSEPSSGTQDAAVCFVGEYLPCSCSNGVQGRAQCTPEGRHGACDCSLHLPTATSPSGPADAASDACAHTASGYVDNDGDGFGAGPLVTFCAGASGHSAVGGDCADDDARAFPSQTVPQSGTVNAIGGGDFNCDGRTDREYTAAGPCNAAGGTTGCDGAGSGAHWLNLTPNCGESGTWVVSCSAGGAGTCSIVSESRTQKCL